MKKIILILPIVILIIGFLNCDNTNSGNEKDDNVELSLNITKSDWRTEVDQVYNHGYVIVSIEGTTNGNRACITTYGYGMRTKEELPIDGNGNIEADVYIAASVTPSSDDFQVETEVMVYDNLSVCNAPCIASVCTEKKITISSGTLNYMTE